MLGGKMMSPIYKQIALDLANRIYHGDLNVGDKIHGRSTLAGEYNVSPETIRRSVKLLEDMEVVTSSQGSGITVLSKENAATFIKRFKDIESIGVLKDNIDGLLDKRRNIDEELHNAIEKVISFSERLKNVNPINTLEIQLPPKCHLVGKSVAEVKFWQNTGATIIGIRRKGELIISPGPYASFEEGDTVLVVGENVLEVIERYFEMKKD